MESMFEKLRGVMCVLFGHSNVVDLCFGYVTCARCNAYLGDTLAGAYSLEEMVVAPHIEYDFDCVCRKNFERLTWKDCFLLPKEVKKRLSGLKEV